ncbi:unnamed protein product [Nezara viridula]|uniref:Uncharacterized protein n=1 Tax=Nezara viridula TaxID=85310 RepID=A0A9P0HBC7_NEZVI|nr:unnamed protein product [Nezara viridula]
MTVNAICLEETGTRGRWPGMRYGPSSGMGISQNFIREPRTLLKMLLSYVLGAGSKQSPRRLNSAASGSATYVRVWSNNGSSCCRHLQLFARPGARIPNIRPMSPPSPSHAAHSYPPTISTPIVTPSTIVYHYGPFRGSDFNNKAPRDPHNP